MESDAREPVAGQMARPSRLEEEATTAWVKSHLRTYTVDWMVEFMPVIYGDHLPFPWTVSRQRTRDTAYRSEGALRTRDECCYFCCTLSGEGALWYGDARFAVPAGTAFLVEVGDPAVSYCFPGGAREWVFLAFEFGGQAAREFVRGLVTRFGPIYAVPAGSAIVERLEAYEHPGYRVLHPDRVDAAATVMDVLLELAHSTRLSVPMGDAGRLVKRAMELIGQNEDPALSVIKLAAQLGVPRERLTRVFQSVLGRSAHDMIVEHRMRRACFLLKDTDVPIKQVAAAAGYTDYANFVRAFRRELGMPPHRFRVDGRLPIWPGRRVGADEPNSA